MSQEEALGHFKDCLAQGKPWFPSLLEAIGLWDLAREGSSGQAHLIGGEALDWLVLAQRLCQAVDGQLPQEELERLLFLGEGPQEVSREEMRRLLGRAKYRACLNYFYGVVVEEALQGAMGEGVGKERRGWGLTGEGQLQDEAFLRLYGAPQALLLEQFRRERGLPQRPATGIEEQKEFTYWLFKYRLAHSEPARVASDTKKGLEYLHRQRQGGKLSR